MKPPGEREKQKSKEKQTKNFDNVMKNDSIKEEETFSRSARGQKYKK